jgi:hypothetical protein
MMNAKMGNRADPSALALIKTIVPASDSQVSYKLNAGSVAT